MSNNSEVPFPSNSLPNKGSHSSQVTKVRSSTDPTHPPAVRPRFNIAKSHPVLSSTNTMESSLSPTSSIFAQMAHHGIAHPVTGSVATVQAQRVAPQRSQSAENDPTPLGGNMLMGNCPQNALVSFNLPGRSPHSIPSKSNMNSNSLRQPPRRRVPLHGLAPSKSVPIHAQQQQQVLSPNVTRQYRNGSGGSEIIPSTSPPFQLASGGHRGHDKKYSVDSTVSMQSMASTTSSVHSINGGLDLAYSVLENIDPQIQSLCGNLNGSAGFVGFVGSGGHGQSHGVNHGVNGVTFPGHGAIVYDDAVTRDSLQRLEVQREEVLNKIVNLAAMLKRIESSFTSAIDHHKMSMQQSLHRFDEEEKGPLHREDSNNLYRNSAVVGAVGKTPEKTPNETPGGCDTLDHYNKSGAERLNELTSSNLNILEQNQMCSGSEEDDKVQYTHSPPSSVDPDPGEEDETPNGGQMLIGQAHGAVAFIRPLT